MKSSRRYLVVANPTAPTRWGFIRIYNKQDCVRTRVRFLEGGPGARLGPMRIRTIWQTNGKRVTDRLFGLRNGAEREHEFGPASALSGHRAPPNTAPEIHLRPTRHGGAFNGRIEDVLTKKPNHFSIGRRAGTTLHRYVLLYNAASQSAFGPAKHP